MQFGQHPAPGHAIAHLSDPHLLADGARQYGVVDTEAGLELALARLCRLDPLPQALVFTGDLADKAEPKAYARLREIVEPAAAEIGAEVIWVMGNHDERSTYASELFGEDSDRPQDRVHDVAGLRILSYGTRALPVVTRLRELGCRSEPVVHDRFFWVRLYTCPDVIPADR